MTHPRMYSPHIDELTTREMQILAAVISGERQKAIAKRLGISKHTVRSHLQHARDKQGVSQL